MNRAIGVFLNDTKQVLRVSRGHNGRWIRIGITVHSLFF